MLRQKVHFSRPIVLYILSSNLSVPLFGTPIVEWKGAMPYETFDMPSLSIIGSVEVMTKK